MEHHFNVETATELGVTEAILLNNLWFWVKKNEANNVHFYDGEYWTYSSMKAMASLHPYLTEKKIRNAVNHLKDEGILLTGNYNKSSYDRTLWYAFTQKGKSIMTKGQMEVSEKANGNVQKGEPIPYINQDINLNGKTDIYRSEFEQLWKLYPRKQGKKKALDYYIKARKKGTTYEEVERGIKAYTNYVIAEKTEDKYIKHGSTFFSEQAWQDDWEIRNSNDTRGSSKERQGVRRAVREREDSVGNGTPEWYRPFEPLSVDE